jgi:hypothetical protein
MQDRLALTTRKASHSIRGIKDTGRRLQDEICLPEYKYTTEEGCTNSGLIDTFDDLEGALSDVGCDHDAMRELEPSYGGRGSCLGLLLEQMLSFGVKQEGKNFAEIGDGTDLFIKEFFDGTFFRRPAS